MRITSNAFIVLICLVLIFSSRQAYAQCTQDDIFQMLDQGYTKREIERICYELGRKRSRGPQMTNKCHTEAGVCQMFQQGPVGQSCYCMTMYGIIWGQTRL